MQLRNGKEFSLAERLSQKTAEARTLQNQSDSPLLRLPGEIRNAIYEYVLGGHHISPRLSTQATIVVDTSQGKRIPKECLFVFSQTCRQTRSETGLMLFSLNDFIGLCRSTHHLPKTIALSKDQCNAIRSIAVPACCFGHFRSTSVATVVPLPGVQRVTVMSNYGRNYRVTEETTERVKREVTKIFGREMEVVVVNSTTMFEKKAEEIDTQ